MIVLREFSSVFIEIQNEKEQNKNKSSIYVVATYYKCLGKNKTKNKQKQTNKKQRNICFGYLLEAPQRGTSNNLQQLFFIMEEYEKEYPIIITRLSGLQFF